MKKAVAAMVIMAIALAMFPTMALGERYGDYLVAINIYTENYMITGYVGNETELYLPAEINGKAISELNSLRNPDYNAQPVEIKRIVLSENIRDIGRAALQSCTSLETVDFSACKWPVTIDEKAFEGCTALKNLPGMRTKYIGEYAFADCVSIENISPAMLPERIDFAAFSGCDGLTEIIIPDKTTTLSNGCFSSCANLKKIIIPDTVKLIEGEIVDGDVRIYGALGSAAYSYAMKHGNEFRDMAQADAEDASAAGNIVSMGEWKNKEIKWMVLEVSGNSALLLSQKSVAYRPFMKENIESAEWEKSDVRQWLNNDFFESAFTAKEQKSILTTIVKSNQKDGVRGYSSGGEDTRDRLFLLSEEEVNRYFATKEAKKAGSMDESFVNVCDRPYRQDGYYYDWWLRTPGIIDEPVDYYSYKIFENPADYEGMTIVEKLRESGYTDGEIAAIAPNYGPTQMFVDLEGAVVWAQKNTFKACVRPAMWVRIDMISQE